MFNRPQSIQCQFTLLILRTRYFIQVDVFQILINFLLYFRWETWYLNLQNTPQNARKAIVIYNFDIVFSGGLICPIYPHFWRQVLCQQ